MTDHPLLQTFLVSEFTRFQRAYSYVSVCLRRWKKIDRAITRAFTECYRARTIGRVCLKGQRPRDFAISKTKVIAIGNS